jgi:hypothetical protein
MCQYQNGSIPAFLVQAHPKQLELHEKSDKGYESCLYTFPSVTHDTRRREIKFNGLNILCTKSL